MRKGTHHSKETKSKISKALIGKHAWNKKEWPRACIKCGEAPAQSIKRPYCKPCRNADERARYDAAKDRERQLKHRYGITPNEFDEMVFRQQGRCAICGAEPSKRLVIDHDHSSGKVRALLCDSCNHLVGYIEREPDLIEKTSAYLKEHSKRLIVLTNYHKK